MTTKIGNSAFYGVASVLLSASVASAGILASHPLAVTDTSGFAAATGSFQGSDSEAGNTLDVTVDYAVFTADDFNTLFPSSGYTPTGSLVYTYQVFVNSPPSNIGVNTQLVLPVVQTTDAAPGTFNTPALGGTQDAAPTPLTQFNGQIAEWSFANFAPFGPDFTLDPGEASYGLVFSSNNVPEFNFQGGEAQSIGGALTAVVPVHVPSNVEFVPAIPEPTSLVLFGMTIAAFARRSR